MTHPPSSSGKFSHSFIESSFHLLRLHFITAEFLENKNIKHQSRTCFLTYFWWSLETMRFLCISLSFMFFSLWLLPSFVIHYTPRQLLCLVKCTTLKGISMQSYKNWMPHFWAKHSSLGHCGLVFPCSHAWMETVSLAVLECTEKALNIIVLFRLVLWWLPKTSYILCSSHP